MSLFQEKVKHKHNTELTMNSHKKFKNFKNMRTQTYDELNYIDFYQVLGEHS